MKTAYICSPYTAPTDAARRANIRKALEAGLNPSAWRGKEPGGAGPGGAGLGEARNRARILRSNEP